MHSPVVSLHIGVLHLLALTYVQTLNSHVPFSAPTDRLHIMHLSIAKHTESSRQHSGATQKEQFPRWQYPSGQGDSSGSGT